MARDGVRGDNAPPWKGQDMIIEKLMNYNYNPRRGLDAEGRRLALTCQADLVYYAVLKAAYKRFGTPGPGQKIENIHADVLGAARDQMARRASLSGLVKFGSDGLVESLGTPGANDRERLVALAKASAMNCEGIRNMVSSHLSGLPEYKSGELSEEERTAAVMKLLDEALEPDSSFMAEIEAAVSGMSHTMDGTADDLYAFWRPTESRSMGYGNAVNKADDGRGVVPVLKLSPLMPEFRRLRMVPGGKNEYGGYYEGPGAELGLYRNQSAAVSRQIGDSEHKPDPTVGNNSLIMYDFERGGMHKFVDKYWTTDGAKDFHPAMYLRVPTDGVTTGPDGRLRSETFSVRKAVYGGEEGNVRLYDYDDVTPLFELSTIAEGMNKAYIWRMSDILRTYSQQELTEDDLSVVSSIFYSASPTIFGDPVADPVGTARNADAYFEYIEHMCSTVRERMPSHEFGIHLTTQNTFTDENANTRGFVPLLWFTGERTDDWGRARSNPTRYFGVYPYMNYTPYNLESTPLVGDIAPATYNVYTVTRGSHRRGNDDINSTERNPYAHVARMTSDLVADMRGIFDAYMGEPGADRSGLEIAKVNRAVGADTARDFSDFVNNDGSVNGQAIIDALVDDMDAVKEYQLTAVAQPVMRDRMNSVLRSFVSRGRNDPEAVSPGEAIAAFLEKRYGPTRNDPGKDRHGRHANSRQRDKDRKALARALERCARSELQSSYGKDMESLLVSKHVFNAFLGQFVDACVEEFHARRDALIDAAGTSEGISRDQSTIGYLNAEVDDMLSGFRQEGRYGGLPSECMDQLFGKQDEDGRAVLRANACRALSRHFIQDDYDNLLAMLSYSDAVDYEPAYSKSPDDVLSDLARIQHRFSVQRYSPDAYDITDGILEAPDDDQEERDAVRGGVLQEKRWFEAVFAGANADPDRFDRSLAWVERDFARPEGSGPLVGLPNWNDQDDPIAHAVYVAKHPLQVEALREAGRRLADIEGDGFSASRLAITPQGMLYYRNNDGEITFKAGPIVDEAGYIQPLAWDVDEERRKNPDYDPDNDEAIDEIRDVMVLDRAADGSVRYDEKGVAITKPARVAAQFSISVKPDGTLANPVVFGALDLRSTVLPGSEETVPLNRYYRLSAKIDPKDGYDYTGKSFDSNLSIYSYKNGVIEQLGQSLELYRISKGASRSESGGLTANGRKAMSVFYTNVGSNSMRSCYRTNTYIIEENPKCVVADAFMSAQVEDMYRSASYDGDHESEAERIANLSISQAHQSRNTLVFPKIASDQDIGLYNMAVNIQQGLASAMEGGNLDRENLRNCDCLSQRVAFAQPSRVLDPCLTGSAKNIGAAAVLTDVADFDWRTRELTVRDGGEGDLSGTNNRCRFTSVGIVGFNFGDVAVQFVEHADGQALDRMELSINAAAKAVNYAKDVRFAMINYGYNMEDGYIIAERAAPKFGHFSDDGLYHPAELWDKIGDSESGNKGVISKIVPTSIGEGMSDSDAEEAFMAHFTSDFLQTHEFNHGSVDDHVLSNDVSKAIQEFMEADAVRKSYPSAADWMDSLVCDDGLTVAQHQAVIDLETDPDGEDFSEEIRNHQQLIYDRMKTAYAELGWYLQKSNAEPFTGNYKLEHGLWQLFRDNPDLDVAVTNVCVCTRSNPSLLMHISEDLKSDQDAIEAGVLDPADRGKSGLVVRENGEIRMYRGAVGTFNMYVDSHTAETKNIDYLGDASKDGRTLGAQETYAMQAKKAAEIFLPYLMANDATRPKDVSRLANKFMMAGYALAMPKDRQDGAPPFQVVNLFDALGHTELVREGDTHVLVPADGSSPLYPHAFVDIRTLAEGIATAAFKKAQESGNKRTVNAVKALGELDFSLLLSPADGGAGKKACDDMLHRLFEASIGRYSGSFILLPDNLSSGLRSGDGSDGHSTGMSVCGTVTVKNPDGTDEKRSAAPLFISAREVENMDSELVAAHIDDKYQFQAFKAALAGAVIEHLSEAKIGAVDFLDKKTAAETASLVSDKLSDAYAKMPTRKSLDLENMNNWLKKNIYKVTNPASLTCVWSGDPTLEPDEAGLSFEKAKQLGFLRERSDIDPEILAEIPDTFEHMAERYEPITDDDLVVVNRSPGQTTGCIRAFRLRITGPTGDGLKIHPAAATIFDGDFDGDTVGVANVRVAGALGWGGGDSPEFYEAMRHEMKTRLTMAGNLLQKASYSSVSFTVDGVGSVTHDDVHPLFIADNADFAHARKNMAREIDLSDGKGGTYKAPACGYDVGTEIERATVMANLLEQVRQCAYDEDNAAKGRISRPAADKIMAARASQVGSLSRYFDTIGKAGPGSKEDGNAKYWARTFESFKDIRDARPVDMAAIEKLEASVCRRVKGVYREMCGYLADPPMVIHGETDHEILQRVIDGANSGHKGKLPQLNALLKFSGTHVDCGKDHGLRVVKGESGFELERYAKNDAGEFESVKDNKFEPGIALDNINNMSDISATDFRTKEIANLVAQGDKSDATGLGGTLAQRLQMIMAPAGYGELALRISGPITQRYLDAKQNVLACETNLTIGKAILNAVYHFKRVDQLQDSYIRDAGHDFSQVYKGQFTVSDKPMTLEEGINQMDNFLQVMGHPALSEIDRAQFEAAMERFVDEDGNLKDPLKDYAGLENITYTAMYGGSGRMPKLLERMSDEALGLFSGAPYEEAAWTCAEKAAEALAETRKSQIEAAVYEQGSDGFSRSAGVAYRVIETEAEQEQSKTQDAIEAESQPEDDGPSEYDGLAGASWFGGSGDYDTMCDVVAKTYPEEDQPDVQPDGQESEDKRGIR